MEKPDQSTEPERQPAERERSGAKSTPPRGNPDRDHESVERGEEQLDKIAGN